MTQEALMWKRLVLVTCSWSLLILPASAAKPTGTPGITI